MSFRVRDEQSVTRLTTAIDMVMRAKGSPMMLAMLARFRYGEFMIIGRLSDGEYSDRLCMKNGETVVSSMRRSDQGRRVRSDLRDLVVYLLDNI